MLKRYIIQAPIVMVFFADTKTGSKTYGSRGKTRYCFTDATIACTYAQLAAQELGLST